MRYFAYLMFFLVNSTLLKAQSQTFNFGSLGHTEGINIKSSIIYNSNTGYGFDFDTAEDIIFHENSLTADSPFYFSTFIPEGNYLVTLVLGSGNSSSETTIKAESRRLMLKKVKTGKGEIKTVSFALNVRTPQINSKESINLKSRETSYLNWDDKLTLEFLGKVALRQISIEKINNIKTLYLAGDSTVTDQDLEPWASWGQMITQYFNSGIVVANYAASGESLSSFKARKRLDKILSLIQPGDYLFIEFGHNDEKEKGSGKGPWKSYSNSLMEYAQKAREKNAIPIFITPTQRRFFTEKGKLKNTHGDYPDAMKKVAKELQIPLIDLTEMTTKMYESWGDKLSRKAFVQYPANTFPRQNKRLEDNTHFNSFGANEIALGVIHGIKTLNLDLKNYIKEIPDYNPAQPNSPASWTTPMSPRFENKKPLGN